MQERLGFLHKLFEREKTSKRFGDRERKQLESKGAIIFEGTGKTLVDLKKIGKKVIWSLATHKSAWKEDAPRERILSNAPSYRGEMAFFADEKKFFVPGSAGKTIEEQVILAEEDGVCLRQELGVNGIRVMIPKEASTLVEMAYFYFGAKGRWLFSGALRARTLQYTDEEHVAEVGFARKKLGLSVLETPANLRVKDSAIVRLIVPR